ncbi:hypothetical protein [Oceanobacillus indicireducens]|uniref:Uncharacterized protein n=1 Tax=Oceanobacillus indicireducens TaxID=1004261 RepID=A0A917Y213_9BACI|nr:hypothetical protein [Oceanobacillus indicireducens]GGN64482.1 hypothetical protein GCM10007971_32420 [Oceanobacillus indicireducens]
MKRYRISYKQEFNGEILQDSYVRTVRSEWELQKAVSALYSDSHVFSVTCEELEGDLE